MTPHCLALSLPKQGAHVNTLIIRSLSSIPSAVSRKARKAEQKISRESEVVDNLEEEHFSFAEVSDICISDIYDAVKGLQSVNDPFEIIIEPRELSIDIGDDGMFVFTFKYKNELMQMNSPISGLLEYKYDRYQKLWVNTKDGHDFRGIVTRDLLRLCAGCPDFK